VLLNFFTLHFTAAILAQSNFLILKNIIKTRHQLLFFCIRVDSNIFDFVSHLVSVATMHFYHSNRKVAIDNIK
jgi:hypothetical protein